MTQTKLASIQVVATPVTDEVPIFQSNGTMASGAAGAAAVAGSNTQVQFNDGGVMGADGGMEFNKGTGTITLSGGVSTGGSVDAGTSLSATTSMTAGSTVRAGVDFRLVSGTANSGGGLKRLFSEATSGALSGATGTIEVNIPAFTRLLGVQVRVDTAVTGPAAFGVAYSGGSTQVIEALMAPAKNTKEDVMYDALADSDIPTSEVDITLTAVPNFTGGVVRAIVYYEAFIAMDNNP